MVPPGMALALLGGNLGLALKAMGMQPDMKGEEEQVLLESVLSKQPQTTRATKKKNAVSKKRKIVKTEGEKKKKAKKSTCSTSKFSSPRKKRDPKSVQTLRHHLAQFPELVIKAGLQFRPSPNKSGCTTFYGRIPTIKKLDNGIRKRDLDPESRKARRREQNRIAACRTRARKRMLKEELARRMGKKLAKKGRPKKHERHNLVFFERTGSSYVDLSGAAKTEEDKNPEMTTPKKQGDGKAGPQTPIDTPMDCPPPLPPPEFMMAAMANPDLLLPLVAEANSANAEPKLELLSPTSALRDHSPALGDPKAISPPSMN